MLKYKTLRKSVIRQFQVILESRDVFVKFLTGNTTRRGLGTTSFQAITLKTVISRNESEGWRKKLPRDL